MPEQTTEERIAALSAKQAVFVVKKLTEEIAQHTRALADTSEIVPRVNQVAEAAGVDLAVQEATNWAAVELSPDASGQVARRLLQSLADDPEGGTLVERAIERYQDTTLDLGVISIGLSAAFLFLIVASDIEVDLGWFHLKKKGLSSDQQVEVAKEVLPAFVESMNPVR